MDLAKIWTRGPVGEPRVRGFPGSVVRAPALILGLIILPHDALAQARSAGPLTWEEGAPLQRISYTPAFETAEVTPRGALSADLWLGFSNIFEQDSTANHVVFLDAERLISATTVRWGVADRLEIGARATLETTSGGFLDSFVLWYHDQLGFGQANRDRFPSDQYAQRFRDGDGTEYLDLRRRTLGLSDVQLFAKWSALGSSDGRSALALRAVARVPAESNRVGDDKADGGVVALGRVGVGAWHLHGMLGASLVRASPELDEVLRGASVSFGLAVERSLTESLAAIAQYQIASPVLRGFEHRELVWPASNLVLGMAGRFGSGWSWDASFQEDLPADTPAIDFTVALRVSRSWR